MCGIIAVLRRRSTRPVPSNEEVLELVRQADDRLGAATLEAPVDAMNGATESLGAADRLLSGVPGLQSLLADPGLRAALDISLRAIDERIETFDRNVDRAASAMAPAQLEELNASLGALKDAAWAIQRDRIPTAAAVATLAGGETSEPALRAYLAIQESLSAIDRLEVRGRDSAGLQVLVRGHGLNLKDTAIESLLTGRRNNPLFVSRSVRVEGDLLSFAYKAAAEIGELGDNVAAIREDITSDDLLRLAVRGDDAEITVLGHTRWASVGIISGPNAHPVNSDEVTRCDGPYVAAALNGDVDNFADLKASHQLEIRPEITTDTKVIPTIMSRVLDTEPNCSAAFRETVNELHGSVAVGVSTTVDPASLYFALRGSGQALYIGRTEDCYIVASEPYGVVEVAGSYLRMDGETPSDAANATATRGQIIHLDGSKAGTMEGLARYAYDGSPIAVEESEFTTAEITTRDVDRGSFPHFLLKEISEAPSSFRKTLRGKLIDEDGRLQVKLGEETIPAGLRAALADGSITRIRVIGQGTAAVAGLGVASAISRALDGTGIQIDALPATELSGFELPASMSETLIVAISQSGTTTDTNRTVDLVRSRGAQVVAIVNRRGSDLTDKSDGVLYTSDGRDVEMSVASTKAFYAQIAAGFLLAQVLADIVVPDQASERGSEVLASLRDLPTAMEQVLLVRPTVAKVAAEFAPQRRYWAIVGNGPNFIAAREIRIKLSELCYKSMACDVTEDKKHIDLSSEPMIVVCAAGLSGSTADDVAKEVEIYRAHQAAPIVIATEGEERFTAAVAAISVPSVHTDLAFILATMVGHLFGYEAALAIDSKAVPLRQARALIEEVVSDGTDRTGLSNPLLDIRAGMEPLVGRFYDELRSSGLDGHLEASTAVKLASLFRYATGVIPLSAYQIDHGRVGTPSVVIEDLAAALSQAIDQLTRPVDAIKHQAKTVTVGISRSDESLLQVPVLQAVLATGAARDHLTYDTMRTLAALDPIVKESTGYTRYRIEGDALAGDALIRVVDRGGIARDLPLRTEGNPVLRGTKHRVALEQKVLLTQGRSDGRLIIIVPQIRDNRTSGIALLHILLREDVPLATIRSALTGYRNRYAALRDSVMETEPSFREDLLQHVPLVDLMTKPVTVLADAWRPNS